MFIAALLTITKTWKQPKCPLTDEWIKKMWYIYSMEYYLTTKKNEIGSFEATWMDLENAILSEVTSQQRDTSYDIPYIRNLKEIMQMNLFTKQKETHRLRK